MINFVHVQMRALYCDPQGKKIFENAVIHSSEGSSNAALQAERSQKLALEKEVQSLQTQLKQLQSVSTNVEYVHAPVLSVLNLEPFFNIIVLYERKSFKESCDYFFHF